MWYEQLVGAVAKGEVARVFPGGVSLTSPELKAVGALGAETVTVYFMDGSSRVFSSGEWFDYTHRDEREQERSDEQEFEWSLEEDTRLTVSAFLAQMAEADAQGREVFRNLGSGAVGIPAYSSKWQRD